MRVRICCLRFPPRRSQAIVCAPPPPTPNHGPAAIDQKYLKSLQLIVAQEAAPGSNEEEQKFYESYSFKYHYNDEGAFIGETATFPRRATRRPNSSHPN